MQNKQEAIQLMNQYGKERRPFFFMIDFLQEKILLKQLHEINLDELQFSLPTFAAESSRKCATDVIEITNKGYSQNTYNAQIQHVIHNIKQGNSFLVNLTCQTAIELNTSLEQVYFQSDAKYKLWYKDEFVVFSPECFVRISHNQIKSFPMKGTIDASISNAKDIILNSAKEKAEHYTIVDLIRNDLSMVSENVEVKRFRYIDELQTDTGSLLQVSSEIKGDLSPNWQDSLGDLMFKLLPAGSISGAPKKKTLEIIAAAENYDRGFYTGVFGLFDGKNLDSAVMIRFIEKKGEGYVYKSGGGITAFSNAEEEYNEMLKKIYVPISRKH